MKKILVAIDPRNGVGTRDRPDKFRKTGGLSSPAEGHPEPPSGEDPE